MNSRKRKSPTIEAIGGFVTVHVALPSKILKSVVKAARQEGHRDISIVIRRALERVSDKGMTPCLALLGI